MKKKISVLLGALMIISLIGTLSVGSFAADPSMLWDFGDAEYKLTSENVLSWEAKDGYMTFTASGPDPYVRVVQDVEDVNVLQWCKVRCKNNSKVAAIELFASTDGDGHSLAGPECTHINLYPDADNWRTYIVYLPNANIFTSTNIKGSEIDAWNWQGKSDFIRLDPMWNEGDGATEDGDNIDIDYIAFFPDKASAVSFRADQDYKITPVEFEYSTMEPDMNASLVWDFGKNTGDEVTAAMNAQNAFSNCDYDVNEKDSAAFIARGLDPNIMIPVSVGDVSAIQWAKVRVKNTSPATAIELFAKTDGDGHGLSGPECTHIYMVPNTEEWMTYIVYLPNANIYTSTNIKGTALDAWNWQGMCDGIRLDPMWQGADGDMADGDTIQIDYIAFFETKEAAENFRKRQDSAVVPVEFENGTDLPDLSAAAASLTAAAEEVVEDVKEAAENAAEAVGDAAEAVGEAAEGAVEAVGEAAANTAETVKEAASGANTGLIIGIVIACVVVIAAVVAFIVSKNKKKE